MPAPLDIDDNARREPAGDDCPFIEMEDGIPVWKHGPDAIQVTSEMVRELMDED